jgi:histidine triad (HIT) family protein
LVAGFRLRRSFSRNTIAAILFAEQIAGEPLMSADCLFCKIAAKQIPSKIVYEDADIFAFEDISPQAPTHILLLPRKHFVSLDDATFEDQAVIGKLHLVAAQLARERNLLAGYRTVFNNGTGAGQSVFHLHLHLLGGRQFRWPPG